MRIPAAAGLRPARRPGPSRKSYLLQLEEDRAGRCLDEMLGEGQLQDGAIALRDRDEWRLVVDECLKAEAVYTARAS